MNNLELFVGVDFDVKFGFCEADGTPIDVRSMTAYMQIKHKGNVYVEPTITPTDVYLDVSQHLTTNHADGENGVILLNIPATDTKGLAPIRDGIYDLKLRTVAGNVYLVASGSLSVIGTVTDI